MADGLNSPWGSLERSQKRVVCAATCGSWFKNMATRIDWLGHRAQATRAWPVTSTEIGLSRPIFFFHSAIFHPNTPCNVGFISVSRHMFVILETRNGNIFGQILRSFRKCVDTWMIENSNWSQKRLVFFTKQSVERLPEVFLTGEPNANKKKNSF